MTFDQFFQVAITIGLGAVSTLLIWGVKELVSVSKTTATLTADVNNLNGRVTAIEGARTKEQDTFVSLVRDVSYIRGKIEDPPTRSRRAANA